MGDFTFLYRGGSTSASPEERQKHMQKWMAWFKDLGDKGHVKDPGHPLESGGKVVRGKQRPSPTARSPRPRTSSAATR